MHRSWIELSRSSFDHNIATIKQAVGTTALAPVIKANGYGHGLIQMAQLCEQNPHITAMCVVSLQEALTIYNNNFTKKPIIVLNILDGSLSDIQADGIQYVISTIEDARYLNNAGQHIKKKISVHIKIDTGLSRAGFLYSHAQELLASITDLPFLAIEGTCTHFSAPTNIVETQKQIALFNAWLESNATVLYRFIHAANSGTLLLHRSAHYTMVRPGITVYGFLPDTHPTYINLSSLNNSPFKPIIRWYSRIIQLKHISPGTSIGYEHTYIATTAMTIALIPVGYSDGYPRALSNQSVVKIQEHYAPIVGLISMNVMMVNVTHVAEVHVGMTVTLAGDDSSIHPLTLAHKSNLCIYEWLTRINSAMPRIITV